MIRQDVLPLIRVRHKRHGVIETIVSLCKLRMPDGKWVDGVVYSGHDRVLGRPTIFCRQMESFCEDFEKIGDEE